MKFLIYNNSGYEDWSWFNFKIVYLLLNYFVYLKQIKRGTDQNIHREITASR